MKHSVSSKHFSNKELSCRCCGANEMKPKFLEALERVRVAFNHPMTVSSCFRCSQHNYEVGGVKNSSHMAGEAIDILIENGRPRHRLIKIAMLDPDFGHGGIGVYPTFVHLDIRKRGHPTLFTF